MCKRSFMLHHNITSAFVNKKFTVSEFLGCLVVSNANHYPINDLHSGRFTGINVKLTHAPTQHPVQCNILTNISNIQHTTSQDDTGAVPMSSLHVPAVTARAGLTDACCLNFPGPAATIVTRAQHSAATRTTTGSYFPTTILQVCSARSPENIARDGDLLHV